MGWKITDLLGATLPLTGNELVEVTQGENSRSVRVSDLLPGFESTLAADLAAAGGSGLVGFQRANESLPGYVADQLRGQAIQLWEFIPKSQWAAIKAGNSAYDATLVAQAAVDYAASIGASIVFDGGTVLLDHLKLKPGLRGLFGTGTIKTNNLSTDTSIGVLVVQGVFYGPFVGIEKLYLGQLTIDCSGGSKKGFFGSSVRKSVIDGVQVKNLSGDTSGGIVFQWECTDNIIANCLVEMPVFTVYESTCYGIQVVGNGQSYAGWGTGNIIDATNRCVRNQIINNHVYNGSHGISINASEENQIIGNYCLGQYQRSVHLSQARFNLIGLNELLQFGSAAIIMSYDSSDNCVVFNKCFSAVAGGEAAIEMYVSSSRNFVACNPIRSAGNYGIYIAIDSSNNRAVDNPIDCTSLRKAALAIESDWKPEIASPFIYSRPNYGAPPGTRTTWANGGSNVNTLKGNMLTNGNASIAAVYVAQVGVAQCAVHYINDQDIEPSGFAHTFYFVEQTGGYMSDIVMNGNSTGSGGIDKVFATRGRAHFSSVQFNDTFNGVKYSTPATNLSQPSVFASDKLNLSGYTSATNVNYFAGGADGQEISVLLGANVTLLHVANQLVLKGAVNQAGAANAIIRFENRAGAWFETGRNF